MKNKLLLIAGLTLAGIITPISVRAHCDSLDGPVVQAARLALDQADVTPVLKWIQAEDEDAIRSAFSQTLKVRQLSPAAAELADRYFFETLVRIHRAGEGAPYTGLTPAGSAGPALAAADQALDTGEIDDLTLELVQHLTDGLGQRFTRAHAAKAHAEHNVAAGRAYVAAYVEFIHYFEQLHAMGEHAAPHNDAHAH
jgi:hypothetical protein